MQSAARGARARAAVRAYLAAALASRRAQLHELRATPASQLARLASTIDPATSEAARRRRARAALRGFPTASVTVTAAVDRPPALGLAGPDVTAGDARRIRRAVASAPVALVRVRSTSLLATSDGASSTGALPPAPDAGRGVVGVGGAACDDSLAERDFQRKIRTQRARFRASERPLAANALLVQSHVRARADRLRMQLLDAALHALPTAWLLCPPLPERRQRERPLGDEPTALLEAILRAAHAPIAACSPGRRALAAGARTSRRSSAGLLPTR